MFNLSKREQIIVISVLILVISAAGMIFMKFSSFQTAKIEVQKGDGNPVKKPQEAQASPQPTIQPTILPKKIIVHIKGQVKNPGVLTLEEGQRVNDALTMAGGQSDKADLNAVNLAEPLIDGQEVYIPAKGEKASPSPVNKPAAQKAASSGGNVSDGKIDLNTADQKQLEQLPGVGPSTAAKILEYRKANNGFKSVNELQEVPGIGAKKFEEMKNSAVVR